jgi:HAD superfamily hydrolase (TIGR01509 family)
VRPAALLFDFNGTLSDDEHIQCEIYRELFAEAGKPLTMTEYFEELAGLSDPEIVRRFQSRAGDGSTVKPSTREAVRYAAERAELAVVSGAARTEIESVLAAAELTPFVSLVVAAEDVAAGKPDPAGYVRALELLDCGPDQALAFEDSEAGVVAAKTAGLYCIALEGTAEIGRLGTADEVVRTLDVGLMQRLLG